MGVYKDQFSMETLAGKPTYVDVTEDVSRIVVASGIKEGVVTVISCHTTCAVFSEEFDHDQTPEGDTFLQADLSSGLNRIFPNNMIGIRIDIPALIILERWNHGRIRNRFSQISIERCCEMATRIYAQPLLGAIRRLRYQRASLK